jgi:hypothetical protein
MGGTIHVESQVGSGSVFWVRLPAGHEPEAIEGQNHAGQETNIDGR